MGGLGGLGGREWGKKQSNKEAGSPESGKRREEDLGAMECGGIGSRG